MSGDAKLQLWVDLPHDVWVDLLTQANDLGMTVPEYVATAVVKVVRSAEGSAVSKEAGDKEG